MNIQNFCTLILENLLVYGGDIQYQTLSKLQRHHDISTNSGPKRYDKED